MLDRACSLAKRLMSSWDSEREAVYISGSYPNRRCISDRLPGCGPLGGIHAALAEFLSRKAGYPYILFLPVDMPALGMATLLRLIESASACRAAYYRGHELPAVVAASEENLRLLEQRLKSILPEDRRSRSIKAFLQAVSASELVPAEETEGEFINLNTPVDFMEWCKGVGK